MTTTSALMIPEASALHVDTSVINVSEVETQEEKDFLMEKGENILRIVALASLEIGREFLEIQTKFKTEDNRKGEGLGEYYKSLGVTKPQVSRWVNKYKAYLAYNEIFGEFDSEGADKFNQLADKAAAGLMTLPTEYREAFFADIANGDSPSQAIVDEVNQRPEVKLSKAEELLAEAKARKEKANERWELVKKNPDISPKSAEYRTANSSKAAISKVISGYEKKIAELTAQIQEEHSKNNEYEKREEKVRAELEKLRFDDASTREERVKRLTNSLTISVPQVLADLAKFFTEQDHYSPEVREHLIEQSTYLTNFIADQLDG